MKRKKEKALQKYIHNLESLEMLQSDVAVLEEDKEKLKASIHTANEENMALSTAISDAQKEIKRLHVRIEKYEKRHGIKAKNELESQFYQQSVYLKLKHIASHPINNVDEEDWTELKQCFNAIVPNFHMWMYDKDYKPNENEYRVCMLTWLQFSPKEISNMIKLSMSYVTLVRKKLLKNMFKIDGTAKEFDIKIRNIH